MFYKEIQAKREELGMTIEQVAQKIKISQDILINIEKGEFESLPDLYIRLFIKSYTMELGLDPEEYLSKYEAESGSKKHDVKQNIQSRENQSNVKNKPVNSASEKNKLIVFISTIAILIFVIVILKQILSENTTQTISPVHQRLIQNDTIAEQINDIPKEQPKPEKKQINNSTQNTEEKTEESQNLETTAALLDTSNQIHLNMEISDTCWVKLIIDKKDTSEALFRPGTIRNWKAFEVFDIRIGRPEIVKLFLNNKKLENIDNGTVPRHLVITKNGIINQ